MLDWRGRKVLITGASRGIGRCLAEKLAARDVQLILTARSEAALREFAERFRHDRSTVTYVKADVTVADDRQRLVQTVQDRWGCLDLLVNNAGRAPHQRIDLLETTETSYDEVMATNLKGPFFLTQLVARAMIELLRAGKIHNPKIINIGSLSAYTSSPNRGEYCISKAGVAMMTTLFADRLAEFGIRVYEVRPGIIRTDMTAMVRDKYDRLFKEGVTPIARWGEPEDVARAVVALAQDALPYSTGEVINVDGGFHLRRL
jgi:NAD(P)-dependent dehydrogenase (short-subunit alcohol dehydrogenase family)